ncbi:MAG: allophanate hydrolase subunit 1 [Devosia sp.]|uniref:5-oxoprolinase subunit B family protein n=1 Tax=Devosia sp. TaxID=1871048 RepID=UPI0026334C62|nr:carboxyltransferase domain-containing protein [Devosia sp.]MDB5539191.1 allophanate hydrolase subunit 1 [Devosia sp.]
MIPLILPLGDEALLVRFDEVLSDEANRAAIAFAALAEASDLPGVAEVAPNLVSVMLRYDPSQITFDRFAGEVRLLFSSTEGVVESSRAHLVPVAFDGEDLDEVAAILGLSRSEFVASHNEAPLRVLATGFAPGFLYCGMHPEALVVPRRAAVRRQVPAGTVLFAAGQTAIASTPIPTGWHVIGHTPFRNFDPTVEPPTSVRAGDTIQFEAAR